jgi:putative Mg2+ transporter-C (MgtC) family protein
MNEHELIYRLLAATFLGGILGLNRNLRGKAAGLRTHALVSLGAALTVLTADLVIGTGPGAERGAVTRAIQGIIAGVGFLGAGAILKSRMHHHGIRGLTTAASIWLAAAIGIACGAGYWLPAVIGVVLALVVLTIGRPIENLVDRMFGVVPRPRRRTSDDVGDEAQGAPGDER